MQNSQQSTCKPNSETHEKYYTTRSSQLHPNHIGKFQYGKRKTSFPQYNDTEYIIHILWAPYVFLCAFCFTWVFIYLYIHLLINSFLSHWFLFLLILSYNFLFEKERQSEHEIHKGSDRSSRR